jgi:hypothetical protein
LPVNELRCFNAPHNVECGDLAGCLSTSLERGIFHSLVDESMDTYMSKTIEELRNSPYHQQLGRKLCAAFVAQQQGIALNTALNKVPDSIGDLWLRIAEFTRQAAVESIDFVSSRQRVRRSTTSIM